MSNVLLMSNSNEGNISDSRVYIGVTQVTHTRSNLNYKSKFQIWCIHFVCFWFSSSFEHLKSTKWKIFRNQNGPWKRCPVYFSFNAFNHRFSFVYKLSLWKLDFHTIHWIDVAALGVSFVLFGFVFEHNSENGELKLPFVRSQNRIFIFICFRILGTHLDWN